MVGDRCAMIVFTAGYLGKTSRGPQGVHRDWQAAFWHERRPTGVDCRLMELSRQLRRPKHNNQDRAMKVRSVAAKGRIYAK